MKTQPTLFTVLITLIGCAPALTPALANAAVQDARPPDRLGLSANGSTLSGGYHGGGGAVSWVHYSTPAAVLALGVERQTIADSRWTFGSLSASWGRGEPASRFNVFGEVHQGSGDDAGRNFDYGVEVLGVSQSFTNQFSVQLEGRQIDIDRTHGNLPKLGVTYLWTPHVSTAVSYAHSVGGNLGTELTTGRIDVYGTHTHLILGGATGHADPVVLNLLPGVKLPAHNLKEGFFGVGQSFTRGELLLLGDYLELAGSNKVTLTLSYTAYIGARRPSR